MREFPWGIYFEELLAIGGLSDHLATAIENAIARARETNASGRSMQDELSGRAADLRHLVSLIERAVYDTK